MSVRFARLRIAGFKSFAEPASIDILPGLTGVVGPNGCGKSNVVEALRWAMGESSARSLRGGEMDDLIFAGTAARPARNLAEVTLTLEDAAGIAPPPFHDQPELQVSRRIERGAGSSYRVNGRDMRARDVQTLFADLASGARSSAMVSQGRVAAIVGARPEERRSILEEAAGITGLHARRHEAELKLRATEANLARAEDLRQQMEARLGELGEQARQAGRYREIAASLREAETGLLALLHARARLAVRQAAELATATDAALRAAEPRARAAGIAEPKAEAALDAPREAEAVARTALERLRIAAETLAHEEARALADAAEALGRLEQAGVDAGQSAARLADAQAVLTRLEADHAAAHGRWLALPTLRLQAEHALQEAQEHLAGASTALSQATARETLARDRALQVTRDRDAAAQRLERLDGQLAALRGDHEAALRDLPDEHEIDALRAACDEAVAFLEAARIDAEQAGEARIQAARDADAAQADAREMLRARDAATFADDEASQRAVRIAAELALVSASCDEAERALMPQAARLAAHDHVVSCDVSLVASRQALEAAEAARLKAQQAHAEARQRLAEGVRHRRQVDEAGQAAGDALSRAAAQHERLAREAAEAEAALVSGDALQAAGDRLAGAEAALAEARQALAEADAARLDAEQAAAGESRAVAEAAAEQAGLEAEADGLARAVGSEADLPDPAAGPMWRSLADTLSVPDGLETALAAVLAEGLDAALDEASPRHWRSMPVHRLLDHPLPEGAVPLSRLIDAPDALGRILSHAGLIEDAADGDILQAHLTPGQCLVTRAGALWRWDGYRLADGLTDDSAAARGAMVLEHRRRLREARARIGQASVRLAELRARAAASAAAHAALADRAALTRAQRDDAERRLAEIRESVSGLVARAGAARARLDAILPQRERAGELRHEAAQALSRSAEQQAALPELAALQQAQDHRHADEVAAVQAETSLRHARHEAERDMEAARSEAAALQARHGEAESRLEALLPQRARLERDHAAAGIEAREARLTLASLASPDQARDRLDPVMAASETARSREAEARRVRQEAELRCDDARTRHAEAVARLERQRSRIEALAPRLEALDHEHREASAILDTLRIEASALADPGRAAHESELARTALDEAREHEAACRETRMQCIAEAASLEATLENLTAGRTDWERRGTAAQQDHAAMLSRLAADRATHGTLAGVPARLGQRRLAHATALADAEQAHARARADLEAGAQALLDAQSERRQADIALSEAREAKLQLQGRAEQADAILGSLLAEMPEPPKLVPGDLSDTAEASLRRRIARLGREREEIGPVNLRADIESRETQERADIILRERDELEAAIARLRGSIGHLNREGRERLLAVFEAVDRHFQTLFARMFNGGRAHLGMVGDDDPLQAGLEIYAQPPGKKLATLSLLSGGEQALTALSLIFAVFRCNPAPICVLDEVDAPLDDANVGRFCALLGDMVAETGTRFLIVTHHQLTMAHMDRLYGITMQERGVSRLLSVDLAAASGMAAPRARTAS